MANIILSWLGSLVFIPIFLAVFVILHTPLVLAAKLGPRAHHRILLLLNISILWALRLTGMSVRIFRKNQLPSGPLIVVSNHQSMFDIPFFIWYLRDHDPRFISKQELGKWIPSISTALRNMGSVLIDRKSASKAIRAIEEFGRATSALNCAAVIFPEGTRARDGVRKTFKIAGFRALLKSMPDAAIVPVVLKNTYRLSKHNLLPVPFGVAVEMHILAAIERPKDASESELLQSCERAIDQVLKDSTL